MLSSNKGKKCIGNKFKKETYLQKLYTIIKLDVTFLCWFHKTIWFHFIQTGSSIQILDLLKEYAVHNVTDSGLTLYHTITTFNNHKKEAFQKHCGKRRKCRKPAFSPFPTMFSTHPKTNFNFSVAFNLSSANAFNLDQSIILSFGKE